MLYAIIVAGGQGTRMKSDVPKQFLNIGEKPILYYTINAFVTTFEPIQIIVVTPESYIKHTEKICDSILHHSPKIKVIAGGSTRFESVLNGLQEINTDEGIVFIHDGVRPFISKALLMRCQEETEKWGNAVPSIPLKDSIRMLDQHQNKAVDRSLYHCIQTPQTFQVAAIKKAYLNAHLSSFTDDATVLETNGTAIHLIPGDERNIKITSPTDLALAEVLIKEFY